MAMGHGLCVSLCVCGEITKNKVGPKKVTVSLSLDCVRLAKVKLADNMKGSRSVVMRARPRGHVPPEHEGSFSVQGTGTMTSD